MKIKDSLTTEFDGDVVVGWWGVAAGADGRPVRVFIPRREQDIAADKSGSPK